MHRARPGFWLVAQMSGWINREQAEKKQGGEGTDVQLTQLEVNIAVAKKNLKC